MKNVKSSKTHLRETLLVAGFILLAGCTPSNKSNLTATSNQKDMENTKDMPTFVIEREIQGVGKSTAEELKNGARTSCSVLKEMGPEIQWQHSYVAENKIYCVYKARNKALIKEHAQKAGVPANAISQLSTVIDPSTAD